MLGYGYKLMASALLTTVYLDANSLVVSNRYTSSDLAYYNKGVSFPKVLVSNLMASINSVLFPAMAKLEGKENNRVMVKKFNQYSCFIIFPMMAGLAAVAPAFIETLLGEKWLPVVPFLQLACLDYAIQPMGISNLQYWKASGRATLYLVTDIIKKVLGISILITAVFLNRGVLGIAWAQVVSTVVAMMISLIPQKKLLGYSTTKQLADVLPHAFISLVMFGVVYAVGILLPLSPFFVLLIQMAVGVTVYLTLAKLFRFAELSAIVEMVMSKLKKTKS